MIQRIQTVYLFISALVIGSLFILPFGVSSQPGTGLLADGKFAVDDHIALISIAAACIGFSLLAIFLFKNRSFQIKLAYVVMLLCLLIPVAAYLIFNSAVGVAAAGAGFSYQAGMFLPAISLVLGFLAVRSIRKDDRLVKSMDRLR